MTGIVMKGRGVSRSTRTLMAWLLTVGLLVAVAGSAVFAAESPAPLTAEQRQVAETIYANQCATCHGASGAGGTIPGTDTSAPALAGNDDVTVPYVDLTIRVGRMPPPENEPFDNRARNPVISDEERTALVAYMAEQFDLPGEIPSPPPGDPARGRQVFAANCAQCHGSTGAGGVAGAGAWTPPVTDYNPTVVAEAIRVGPFEMPAFGADQITDQEIGDVAAYLEFVDEEHGTPLGLVELNPVYASGFAFLFAVAILFSALWIAGRPTHFPDATDPEDAPAEESP